MKAHSAGIQTSKQFGEVERSLKQERQREDASKANEQPAIETVYRDKKGKKLDMLSEFMRQQSTEESKKLKLEQAQYEWGKGIVQKKDEEELKKELLEISQQPFARMADDPKLETLRKKEMRDGDPMMAFFKKKEKERVKRKREAGDAAGGDSNSSSNIGNSNSKPLYEGPLPTPNRFGILPGYRWDAVDRGNGFENRLLTKMNDRASLKEDEYKWSVSDL